MEVGNVVIRRCCRAVVVDQAVRISSVIVNKIQRSGRFALGDGFPQQLSPSVDVLVSFRYGFFCFAAVEHRFLLGTILLLPGCRIVCGSPAVLALFLREDEIHIKFRVNLQQVADFYAIFFKNLAQPPLLFLFGQQQKQLPIPIDILASL